MTEKKQSDHPLNRVAIMRRRRGLSQMQLSAASRITQTSLSKIETGRQRLNETTALDIAAALNCQPGDLMPVILDGKTPVTRIFDGHQIDVFTDVLTELFVGFGGIPAKEAEQRAMAAIKIIQLRLDGLAVSDG